MAVSYVFAGVLGCVLLVHGIHASEDSGEETGKQNVTCTFHHTVDTKAGENWYGFLANITEAERVEMNFAVTYPASKCCLSILLYNQNHVNALSAQQTCQEKAQHAEKILLDSSNSDCMLKNSSGMEQYSCVFKKTMTNTSHSSWYVAMSNCNSTGELSANYTILAHVLGEKDSCPGSDISGVSSIASDVSMVISLLAAVLCISLGKYSA